MQPTFTLLLHYSYFILFPIAVFEGPIISIIAGLLVSTGQMNFLLVILIIMFADIIGDTMYYSLGRWGGKLVHKFGHKIGITHTRLEKTKVYFHENHNKAVVTSKIAHGVGPIGLVLAGILKVPYIRYIRMCFYVTFVQSLILTSVGMLFGHAYVLIDKYLNYFAASVSVGVLTVGVLYVVYRFEKSQVI
ncbi:MAG: VTT domain-containing protein [Minisyncoccia bacterium]